MANTTNKSILQPANGSYVNTWDVPYNADMTLIDAAFGGYAVINPTGASGTVALTAPTFNVSTGALTAQGNYVQPNLVIGASLTGQATLTANVTYQLPSGVGGVWTVYNNTTGAFTVTLSSAGGGTSVVLPQGNRTIVVCDGTNVSVAQSATTAITQPQGTNNTTIATTAFVLNQGIRSSGQQSISSSTTLTLANSGGNILLLTGGITVTFPSGLASGTTFFLSNISTSNITFSFPGGSDFPTTLYPNQQVALAADGNTPGYYRTIATGFTSFTGTGGSAVLSASPSLTSPSLASPSITGSASIANAYFSSTPSDTNTLAVGYRGIPQDAQTASYTLALTDNGGHVYLSGSTASQTVTIPANASIAFPIGATVSIVNDSTQSWSIAITTDTLTLAGTGSTGTRTLARYGVATAIKVTSTKWYISGAGLS